ncbi:MAG: hypothetical protein QW838_02870 [Candidatus Nitrosotenuis sp.]
MPRRQGEFRMFTIPSFGGGINTSLPATDIGDSQAVEILNYEYDLGDNLVTRGGVRRLNDSPLPKTRITSVVEFRKSNGDQFLVFTTGAKVYQAKNGMYSTNNSFLNITGNVQVPDDQPWTWRVYRDLLIGAHGHGTTPLVKWDGTATSIAPLGGSPPQGRFLEVWNNRVFTVSVSEPNQLKFSKLGDPEDWTATGITGAGAIDIDARDGDVITGLYAHKEFLFIFKRHKIYVLIPGSPNTDNTQWKIQLFSKNLGTISNWSIQAVRDDLVFLSDFGITTLQAAQITGDFLTGFLSADVRELSRYQFEEGKTIIPSVVNEEKSQYWIAFPLNRGVADNEVVYVMDFSKMQSQGVRWVRFAGKVVGTSYTTAIVGGKKRVIIGGTNFSPNVYRYGDSCVFDDDGSEYWKRYLSKAFVFDYPLARKEFNRFGFQVALLSDSACLDFAYILDENQARKVRETAFIGDQLVGARWDQAKWDIGRWGRLIQGVEIGALWDVALWDQSAWAGRNTHGRDIVRKIAGPVGRRGQSIQFEIENRRAGDGFIVKTLMVEAAILTRRWVDDPVGRVCPTDSGNSGGDTGGGGVE